MLSLFKISLSFARFGALTALITGACANFASTASAQRQVCSLTITLRIGGDDVRGNTTIKVSAGGQSFTVAGGIPNATTATRNGRFPACVPESALANGIELTSISNGSWPETTDNWNMDGVAFMNADTGRLYFRTIAPAGTYRHRFSGEQPTWKTTAITPDTKPFMDRRYSQCVDDQAFVRFADPLHLGRVSFTVVIRRPATTTSVPAPFWPDFNDWGGSVSGLGIARASSTSLEFLATTTDGRTGSGVLFTGCNPIGL